MNITRSIVKAARGGREPQLLKDFYAHQDALRADPAAQQRRHAREREAAIENRSWLVPGLVLACVLVGAMGYFLRDFIDPWLNVGFLAIFCTFMWKQFCWVPRNPS